MKVELLVNLKIADGRIIAKGTVFSDESGSEIPAFILKRLKRGMAKVISGKMPAPPPTPPVQGVGADNVAGVTPAAAPVVPVTEGAKVKPVSRKVERAEGAGVVPSAKKAKKILLKGSRKEE